MAGLLPEGAAGLLSLRSARAAELGLSRGALPAADDLLDLLAREPRLLRRPLVTDGVHLVVGYDERALQALLGA